MQCLDFISDTIDIEIECKNIAWNMILQNFQYKGKFVFIMLHIKMILNRY